MITSVKYAAIMNKANNVDSFSKAQYALQIKTLTRCIIL